MSLNRWYRQSGMVTPGFVKILKRCKKLGGEGLESLRQLLWKKELPSTFPPSALIDGGTSCLTQYWFDNEPGKEASLWLEGKMPARWSWSKPIFQSPPVFSVTTETYSEFLQWRGTEGKDWKPPFQNWHSGCFFFGECKQSDQSSSWRRPHFKENWGRNKF